MRSREQYRQQSNAAIEDAIYICAYFNLIDRVADSLHFDVLSAESFVRAGFANLQRGYAPPDVGERPH